MMTSNKQRLAAEADAMSLEKRGCTQSEYIKIRDMRGPTRAFTEQRRNARNRRVSWELNLWQWWTIWRDSGHWEHRGRGQGYVMCRVADAGPYAVGNVFIAPAIENNSKQPCKVSGLPIGVHVGRGGKFRATRILGGEKYDLGFHDTPELAQAAYLSLGPIGCPATGGTA